MKEEETHAILKNLPKLEKVGKFEELRCHLVSEGAFPKELLDRVLVDSNSSQSTQEERRCFFRNLTAGESHAFQKLLDFLNEGGEELLVFDLIEDAGKFQIDHCLPPEEFEGLEEIFACSWNGSCSQEQDKDNEEANGVENVQNNKWFTVVPAKELYAGYTKVEECYKMTSHPRGLALIINNIVFTGDPTAKRAGAEHDSVKLTELFLGMGYEVVLRENVSKNELLFDILPCVIDRLKRFRVDSIVVSINSHGYNCEMIRMSDALRPNEDAPAVDFMDVLKLFTNRRLPEYIGKPKVFLVNACRGTTFNKAVSKRSSGSGNKRARIMNPVRADGPKRRHGPDAVYYSEFSDTFVLRSTVPGYVSLRDVENGTWFAECVGKVFAEHAHEKQFSELKGMVTHLMETKMDENSRAKQSCHYEEFGSTRRLYFNPGL